VLAERDDVGDGGVKLLLCQFHLAHEVMQVANEGGHDLLESGIGGALKLGQYRGRDVSLIFDDHGKLQCAILSVAITHPPNVSRAAMSG
jgi:hypothetical protein